ncbi:sialic acid TRAP transporter substrate-binding protein SiaP [uncultured Cocleimonas sp.]|uniref:sialic acid TRAP transporter substrate-binding protein SiaP n=1 Tax=uncultured Cocleimonas sp. TaxID=1051587 RepID=UPI0026354EE8|nr:sialic acid TRAP transporter substrate-binding protein SiaP [uncultured Cocleimonas sp.]
MKMLKKMGVVLTVALLTSFNAQAAEELKFAHVYEVSHPLHKAAEMAAEKIEKATEGRVKVKVFPASQLGKEVAINEGLSFGTVDVIYTGASFAGAAYGPISMTNFPFTLRGLEHWKNYRDSDLFKEIAAGYDKATNNKSRVVALNYYGARHVTSNKPITKPDDMKNLKIRVPNAPAFIIFPKATGANPTPMAFAEVYLALQQGVVDAQENPLTTIKAKRFYEVQSNINLTSHIVDSVVTIVSERAMGKLSDADQKVVITELKEAAKWTTEEIIAAEQTLVDWFKGKGITVNDVDRAPFITKVTPLLDDPSLPFSAEDLKKLQAIPGN